MSVNSKRKLRRCGQQHRLSYQTYCSLRHMPDHVALLDRVVEWENPASFSLMPLRMCHYHTPRKWWNLRWWCSLLHLHTSEWYKATLYWSNQWLHQRPKWSTVLFKLWAELFHEPNHQVSVCSMFLSLADLMNNLYNYGSTATQSLTYLDEQLWLGAFLK